MNRKILYDKIRNKLNDTFRDYLVLYKKTCIINYSNKIYLYLFIKLNIII